MQSLINNWVRGVDTYTHNGSTWLIFTDKKKWVIELTDDKTLWYNYNFFKQIFEFTSLNVVDNQQYITKWVEDNIMNKGGLIRSYDYWIGNPLGVDDVLENGVKETYLSDNSLSKGIEYTIENGVRHTQTNSNRNVLRVENTIQNGVKETQFNSYENESWVKGVIKGGVKETKSDDFSISQFLCEEVIDKGVKETNHVDVMKFFDNKMEETLENGIRLTEYQIGDTFDGIDDIIENGVKETNSWNESIIGDLNQNGCIDNVINNGVKSSIPRQYVGENIIDKVIDKGVIETHDDVYHHKGRIDGVIKNGVKETKHANKYDSIGPVFKESKIKEVIENGTKNPTD